MLGSGCPGFDSRRRLKFFHKEKYFSLLSDFSASVSETLTLDVWLFYLSVFPAQLVKSIPILLSFFLLSPLPLCASRTK